MSKHTPGPWRAEGQYVVDAKGDGMRTWSAADAKLIATAPALADALEAFYRQHEGSHAADEYCEDWCAPAKQAAVALRAAGRIP